MSFETGPVVSIEQRRLTPEIETVLTSLISKRGYFTDPGFSEGFGGDDARVVSLKHSFASPTDMHFSITAINDDGGEIMISTELAHMLTQALNVHFKESDLPYITATNPSDTTVNTGFAITRNT